MTKKNILLICLPLLIVSMTIAGVNAQLPILSLNPMSYEAPAPGTSFTIDVNITDITGMGACEFKLGYNTTLLDAVEVIKGPASVNVSSWLPINITGDWSPINDTIGQIWVGAIYPWGKEFTGNGTVVTINFTATELGNCTLHFYDTELTDSLGTIINHDINDGEVTVVPEFPGALVAPLLLMATLAASFLGKMLWSRKRKDTLTTE